MARRALGMAAMLLLGSCTVDTDFSAEGFACSAEEPCPGNFRCELGLCSTNNLPSDAGPVECLPALALSDEFPGDALDAQWTSQTGNGTSAVVGGGVLTLSPRPNTSQNRFATVRSAGFSVDGKRVFVEVPGMVDVTTSAIGEFHLASSNSVYYFVRQDQGVLRFGTSINNSEIIAGATPYSASSHRWWQMRVTDGRVYADFSADGRGWVNLDSVAVDVIPGDLSVEFSAGTRERVNSPGAMQVDNLNAGSGLCL